MSNNKRILIIGPAWIGDMIMAQTLFKYLKNVNPNQSIDVLAPSFTVALTQRMPEINSSLVFPLGHGEFDIKQRYRLGKQLRQTNYDQAIILTNSFKSALTPFFAKIPIRTGWLGEFRIGLLNDLRCLKKEQLPLMIQRFAALGLPKQQSLPITLKPFYPALRVDQGVKEAVVTKLKLSIDKPILALCPGAEYGPAKRWPIAHFAQIAREKIKQGWAVWLFGSRKESELAQEINQQAKHQLVDLTGKTSILEAIDLMSLATVVISNDSGLMHIAAALNKPLVVLYGSSSPKFTPPLTNQVEIINLNLPCSPCFERVCPLNHFKCMNEISPTLVLSKIETLLQYDKNTHR